MVARQGAWAGGLQTAQEHERCAFQASELPPESLSNSTPSVAESNPTGVLKECQDLWHD
jgi:hypothetical protein